ncbi:MAG: sensor histidine kinase, partial [Myxococcales bacterium]
QVVDTGVGFTNEVAQRIFDPFVQVDATLTRGKAGLGLGLALVKGVIELHGGTVSAVSAGLGRGSAFTLYLPLSATGTNH